jgi:hypothetical protein
MKFDVDLSHLPKHIRDAIPSFEEFKKNPDKFRARVNWQKRFELVDLAGNSLKGQLQKVYYEIAGYRCKTLHEVESVARREGIDLNSLEFQPVIIPNAGHKCDILVRFVVKGGKHANGAM